jgi:hypothetical protein
MTRNINVFTPVVVVAQNETFNWVVEPAELPPNESSIDVESDDWPLPNDEYEVSPNTPVSVTVPAKADPGSYSFDCDPNAPNAHEQTLVVIKHLGGDPCGGATVAPGGYFIWINDTNGPAIIKPNPNNPSYWPLPDDQYEVPPNDWLVLQVPDNVEPGDYPIDVTDGKGGARCTLMGQPIIIVSGDGTDTHQRNSEGRRKA